MKEISVFKKYNSIGILGGTFNPIHNGHLMLAQRTRQQFPDIEKVIIMPNNKPAYKGNNEITSPSERINMIKLAAKDYDYIEVSDIEIRRGGVTYSYDTLMQIKEINPEIKIFFIVGADSLFTIDKWYRYNDFLSMCTLLVARRRSDYKDMLGYANKLKKRNSNLNIEFIDSPEMDISSSAIRKFLSGYKIKDNEEKKARIEKYLDKRVPFTVKEYILNNYIYLKQ